MSLSLASGLYQAMMSSRAHRTSQPHQQLTEPTAQQLRSLVLDYLCHKCYTRTARAFARDSIVRHLDADGDELTRPESEGDTVGITDEDLKQVELRKEVQSHILRGRVDDATAVLNTHFPSVLSGSEVALSSKRETRPPPASSSEVIRGIIPFTIEPAHLFLDLRVLAFIEASRTAPLEGTRHHTSQSKLTAGPASEISPPRVSTPSNIRDPSAEADGDAHLNRLLQHVYELYDCAQALEDPKERAAYQDELSRVSTLLAYKVPEHSRLSKYFGQERRQAVADEINSAILYRTGFPSTSYLELAVRYNTAMWNYMSEQGYKVRPSASKAAGAQFPPWRRQSHISTALQAKSTPISETEVIPPFDLHEFLSS
ncbi:hypothetical protein BV25DRAFT_1680477 [Artomyces pyxidatus]|uniref:Uncharacterized protein n=1 Tax=Artomyces pyxidatus TaxID=48021 RepID=A0ACB8TB96_9AGAM|nr:hypothetical protein BV25DRAFT_1680477 [Artomyces pyxidatus]